jgi:ribosome recycling factor
MIKLIIILLLLLSSCVTSQQQAQKKIDKLVQKFPALVQVSDSEKVNVPISIPENSVSFDFNMSDDPDHSVSYGLNNFEDINMRGNSELAVVNFDLENTKKVSKVLKKKGYTVTATRKGDSLNILVHQAKKDTVVSAKVPVKIIKAEKPDPTFFEKLWKGIKTFFWIIVSVFWLLVLFFILLFLYRKINNK